MIKEAVDGLSKGWKMRRLVFALIVVSLLVSTTFVGGTKPSMATPASLAAPDGPVTSAGSWDNAALADVMLRHVGEYGGAVCVEAGRSGATGGAPLGSGNNADGECRATVNCAVWIASNHTMWIGGGANEYSTLVANGTEQSWASATKGDVIQWPGPDWRTLHTAVVVANLGGGNLDVVDSNFNVDHRVRHHTISQSWRSGGRIFRLGTVNSGPPPPAAGSPIGHVDEAEGLLGGGVHLRGWVMDPDSKKQPTDVHAYLDGPAGSGARSVNLGTAAFSRQDVADVFPGSSAEHGFDTGFMGVGPGHHTIFVYGINVGGTPGDNILLQQVGVDVAAGQAGTPAGNGDAIEASLGSARVQGWAIDFDAPTQPLDIHAYVDGKAGSGARGIDLGLASTSRPDVANVHPQAGANHGFNAFVTGLLPGQHTIFLYAINKAGAGDNTLIGILTTGVPGGSPAGSFDTIADNHSSIRIRGWVIDPDAVKAPVSVHAYIDGRAGSGARGIDLGAATTDRFDVANAFPGVGPAHGFDAVIDKVAPGDHTVWVYAINASGPGDNVLVGARKVTVTPKPTAAEPAPPPAAPAPATPAPARPTPAAPVSAPAGVSGVRVTFPKGHTAVLSWPASAGATGYQVRISAKNSTTRWYGWRSIGVPHVTASHLKKRATYRFQVAATGPGGTSPTTTWRFKQRR